MEEKESNNDNIIENKNDIKEKDIKENKDVNKENITKTKDNKKDNMENEIKENKNEIKENTLKENKNEIEENDIKGNKNNKNKIKENDVKESGNKIKENYIENDENEIKENDVESKKNDIKEKKNENKENYIKENISSINTNNNNIQKDLYIKQEKEIINNYNEKKNKIKNYYDIIYEIFKQSQDFYELFINLIKDYKEIKLKNIENLNNLLNKYLENKENEGNNNNINNISENNQRDTIKREFKEIINNQIKAEKEKINKLNLENITKDLSNDLNNSQKLLNNLNDLYNSYINSINAIQKKHLKYLKYFNNYEIRLVDMVDKNINNINLNNKNDQIDDAINDINSVNDNKNNIDINDFLYDEKDKREFNEMTTKLIKKEKNYRKLLEEYEQSIKQKYLKFKECIDDLSKYHSDFNEQENQIFTFIYLGYIISIETQHSYQKKELNFENLTYKNYQNYKELNQLFENLDFEKYNMILISSNKDDNHICRDIPPEIIRKLSNAINHHFPYIPILGKNDYEDPNLRIIRTVNDKIFKGDFISPDEENNFINVLIHKKYRLGFLKSLNSFRAKGKFIISKENIIILGNAIRTIIDLYDIKNEDFEVLKLIIIMCQTYYTINDKKKKVYLIRFIEDHDLFQSEELWEFYIEESMNREIKKKESIKEDDDLELDQETKNLTLNNLYFSVFLSVTQNILEFQIDKEIIRKILVNLINKKYNLMPIYFEQILSLIEETVYQQRNKFNINIDILGKEKKCK